MEPEMKVIELSKTLKQLWKKEKKKYNEERNWRYIKNQLELPELKSIVFEMRNSLDDFNSRLDWRIKDQWIWRHNNRNYPIWNGEWKRKKALVNCGTISSRHICNWSPRRKGEREMGRKKISWRNNGWKFPIMMKSVNP